MKFKALVVTLLVFLQFTFSQNASISSDVKEHIKARVDNKFNPSVTLAYIEGDAVSYFNYGKTEIENGKAVNENTVYEIGSISKVFTTILLADEVLRAMQEFLIIHPITVDALDVRRAADYLVSELGRERVEFIGSKYAQR